MFPNSSCDMALRTTYEKVELLTMLSWLSTFGGAFSNLGDEFGKCVREEFTYSNICSSLRFYFQATIAGKISMQQMKLALRLGDPYVMARCKLYYSIALIQKGIIGPAKRVIRDQYQFAKKDPEADPKLIKMCLGIWSKLLYVQQLRKDTKLIANKQLIQGYLLLILLLYCIKIHTIRKSNPQFKGLLRQGAHRIPSGQNNRLNFEHLHHIVGDKFPVYHDFIDEFPEPFCRHYNISLFP